MAEKSTPDRLVQGRMPRCLARLGIPIEVCLWKRQEPLRPRPTPISYGEALKNLEERG